LNYFLSFFGQKDFAWAGASSTAMPTVVLVDVWVFTPFIALLVFAAVRGMPQAPMEAARVDGASKWFVFRHITLPYMMPYIVIAVTFRLIDSMRAFDIIYGMTKGGPGDTLMNLQVSSYTQAFVYTDISTGSAYMLINWVIIYVLSTFLIRYWRKSQDKLA
jgi:multiple sugar transport system permease protein